MAEDIEKIKALERNYQDILEFIDKMEQVSQFPDKIDITSNIMHIWEVFLEQLENAITLEVGALFLVDEETFEFVLKGITPEVQGQVCEKELAMQIECGAFSWVINRGQPALVPSLVFQNEKTIVMLPLVTSRRTLGVVMILTPIEESAITLEILKILKMLAKQFSLVMENVLLYDNLNKEHENLKHAQTQVVLSEKLASVGRLASGASHEILNPLQIISGHTQLLMMDKNLDAKVIKYLDKLKEQSDRIAKIVKGLSQFSKELKSSIEVTQINDLIEKVLSVVDFEIKHHQINVRCELYPDLPGIMGDSPKISQVLINMVTNAIDVMPDGGDLTIKTYLNAPNDQSTGERESISILFKDSGPGIDTSIADQIFDPFFTTKSDSDRSGLGLAISYDIIKEHDGLILIDKTDSKGAIFRIILPAAK